MALFRRNKSPFAYEIDRFHTPEPPEPDSLIETPRPKEYSAPPESPSPAPSPGKRGWFRRTKPETSSEPEKKDAHVAQHEAAKQPAASLPKKPVPVKVEKAENPPKSAKPQAKPSRWGKSKLDEEPVALPGNLKLPKSPKQAAPSRPDRKSGQWFDSAKKGSSEAAREGTRKSDLTIAALGISLGIICALFPWYIFFNQEQFGVRAMKFEGGGQPVTGPLAVGPQPQRIGAPMDVKDVPVMELDLFATGTLPDKKDDGDATPSTASLAEQPFPAEQQFKLVHVANGRAMIEDDAGLWVVQPGSVLPDSSTVQGIEKRGGKWVMITSGDRIVEMTP